MPVEFVPEPDGPGYRWGSSGTVYRFETENGRARARRLAARQGRAIERRQGDGRRRTPWKIQERRAPSPRSYERLVTRWVDDMRRVILRELLDAMQADAAPDPDEVIANAAAAARVRRRLDTLVGEGRLPKPPTPERLIRVTAGAQRQAIRRSRQDILATGTSAAFLSERLGIEPGKLLGVDIAPTAGEQSALAEWAQGGIDYITKIETTLLDGLDRIVSNAVRGGVRSSELAKQLTRRFGIEKRHAKLIARDQTNKLNGRVTKATQQSAGIEKYKWRSSRDERTRDRHRELDGTIQRWDSPPLYAGPYDEPAHPGEAIQCRCVAVPVVE